MNQAKWIFLTIALPWLISPLGLADDKFKVILIGRQETTMPEFQNEQFSDISSVDADEEGNIYVLDGREAVVKVFNASGLFLRKLLRPGPGPEEIWHPFKVKWNRYRKTLFVLDQYGYSLKEFSPAGKELKKYPLPGQMWGFFSFAEADRFFFLRESGDRKSVLISQYDLTTNRSSEKISTGIPFAITLSRPGFVVSGDKVWLCSEDRMQLFSYSLKDGRRIDRLDLPEEYRPFRVIKTPERQLTVVFQYGVPIVFDGSLHVLVFRYRYSGDSFRTLTDGEPEATSVQLYRLRSGRLEKRADLGSHEGDVSLGFAHDRRLAFFHESPYPQVKILDLQ